MNPEDDLTPDELEALQLSRAAKDVPPVEEDEAPSIEALQAVVGEEAPAADDLPAETAAAGAAEDAAPAAPADPYRTLTKEAIADQRAALRAEKQKAFSDFDEGVIDRSAYLAIESRVDDSLEELTAQRTLQQANEQTRLAAQEAKLAAIAQAAKQDGSIDYSDPAAADEFNAALQFVASIKANAAMNFDRLADKAHTMVLAQRGIVAPKPAAVAAPAVAAPPAPKVPRQVPPTLMGLPQAGAPPVGDDLMTQFSALDDPDAAEAMLERMPAARRDQLRRSTMPTH